MLSRKWSAILLAFVLIMISMVTTTQVFAEMQTSRIVQLDDGWSFAKGIISPEQVSSTKWTNIDDISKQVMKTDEVGNRITYRILLPSIDCKHCSIYFGFIYRDFRIFINGSELIRYGDVDNPNHASQSLRELMFYEFDLMQGERNEIVVQVKSDVSNIGFLAPIQIGDPYIINKQMYENNIENMIVNVLVGFTGIVVLVVYFPIRRERLYLLFGLTCIVASGYLLARNDLFLKWSETPSLNYHFEYLGLLLLPTLLTLYMQHFYKEYKPTIIIVNSFMAIFWFFIFIRYFVFDI